MNEQGEHLENDYKLRRENPPLDSESETDGPAPDEPKRTQAGTTEGETADAEFSWTKIISSERTLADQAYAAIYAAIINGSFGPGERLRIEDLSASLRISPTPIREALNRLEAAGLAEHVPHRGSRVSMVSAREFRELYELRFILEPLAISKAAERITPEEAETAQVHLGRISVRLRKNELGEAWDAHTAFHFTLYRAARWRWLERLIVPLWDSCRRYRLQQDTLRANLIENHRDHENILKACVAHEPELAAKELYNHLARNANLVGQGKFGGPFFQLRS